MNVWPTLAPVWQRGKSFEFGGFVIHLVIPLVVFLVAEVMPVVQQKMNEAITNAYRDANRAETPPPNARRTAETTTAPVPTSRLRLPAVMLDQIRDKARLVEAEGRALTTDDIRTTVRVPEDMAHQILKEVQTNNGHAFAQ